MRSDAKKLDEKLRNPANSEDISKNNSGFKSTLTSFFGR